MGNESKIMPDSEEETYSIIFKSLKHPARRRILRMLAEKPKTFSRILEDMGISSSHLTYHLENLGELVTKLDDGSYRLSSFGKAAVLTMKGVEESPNMQQKSAILASMKWRTFFASILIGIIFLAGFSFIQYNSLSKLSSEHSQLVSRFEQLSEDNSRLLSWGVATEKVMTFLKDVIQLDTTKYYATLDRNTIRYSAALGGITEETLTYRLTSDESELVVDFRFRNQTLSRYRLDVIEGSPIYSQAQPDNLIEITNNILQRYQNYTNSKYLEPLKNILMTTNEITNIEKTVDDIKFTISTQGNDAEIQWMYTTAGIDYPSKGVDLIFDNNILRTLTDGWYLFNVGSTEINVSKDEAIDIALKYLEGYSWNTTQDGDWVEVTDFVILDEPIVVRLLPHSREEPLSMIPFWYVTFYLDKIYPGNVNRIGVGVWADTGIVQDVITLAPE